MNPAVMLTLASIVYRGCNLNLSDPHNRELARDAMVQCLNTFDKVKGQWELVWGPAGFSPDVAGLDISAMYVARQVADPSQIAIIVRGTNLFSLPDWASNLLIEQRPWPYPDAANPGAMVSQSTELGLSFLQRLLSAPPSAATQSSSLWSSAGSWLASHNARVQFALLNLVARLRLPPSHDLMGPLNNEVQKTLGKTLSDEQRKIVQQLASAITNGRGQVIDEAALLKQVDREQQSIAGGISLLDFLRASVKQGPPHLDIYVTGHSKGGPLAVALATWLADTQGSSGAQAEQWDPDRHVTLHCYNFAAPTPGNEAFASHFRSRISDRYRLFNPDDLVPHVWNVDEAAKIPGLYSNGLGFLDGLVQAAIPILTPLNYQHETSQAQWTQLPPHDGNLVEQIKFNHLDAYLKQLGILGGGLDFESLFLPVS